MSDSMAGYADSTEDAYWDELGERAGILISDREDPLYPMSEYDKCQLIMRHIEDISDEDTALYLIDTYRI